MLPASLIRKINRRRKRRPKVWRPPPLTIEQILAWADQHHARTGQWPMVKSGRIRHTERVTWSGVDAALTHGNRGLPGGSSLAKLLAAHRGHRNRKGLRPYTVAQILAWADQWYRERNEWPNQHSGPIPYAPGETWRAVNSALFAGIRGLSGGDSLIAVLVRHRGLKSMAHRPRFKITQIRAWAAEYRRRHGKWPSARSGTIPGSDGESWSSVNVALRSGCRGLPGGSSLARLLRKPLALRRGDQNEVPRYSNSQILRWADRWHHDFGSWPAEASGPIPYAPGETWSAVNAALRCGRRGLTGGDTLIRLLVRRRGIPNERYRSKLDLPQILAWADDFHRQHGRRPSVSSGDILNSDGDTWRTINEALLHGHRGLPSRSSLTRLLQQRRGVRNARDLPGLTIDDILRWADEHHAAHGSWPTSKSGLVPRSDGDTWATIANALHRGRRGIPRPTSLARILAKYRGRRSHLDVPKLRFAQILKWADRWFAEFGSFPRPKSGAIPYAPGENWSAVDVALHQGHRGLPGGDSLTRLLARHRGVRRGPTSTTPAPIPEPCLPQGACRREP